MSSKTTTYVVRTNNAAGFDARSTDSMPYTHAVVSAEGDAYSWHTSEALARKAASTRGAGFKVVKAEAHEGTKATVVKRISAAAKAAPKTPAEIFDAREKATEAFKAEQKAKAPKAAKAAAPKADAKDAAPKAPRTTAVTEGEQKCRVCAETKPVTAFPTKGANKDGVIGREDRCRKCRDAARKAPAAKATKAPAAKAAKATPAKATKAAKATTKKSA